MLKRFLREKSNLMLKSSTEHHQISFLSLKILKKCRLDALRENRKFNVRQSSVTVIYRVYFAHTYYFDVSIC
jgi:hypothetical protein